ncbi:hypothetical protein WJX82_008649 [Trebouxia sp. C0006]
MCDQAVGFDGEFDEAAASLYFFDNQHIDPVALTASGEQRTSVTQQSVANEEVREPETCQAAPQSAAKRASRAESNRRWQKKFREKQRTKWQRLQEEANASAAADTQPVVAGQAALAASPCPYNQVSDRFTFAHSILYCARSARSNDKWTSTVHHTAEVMSMYQAGRMAPQQMAVLWQDYAREVAICLATGGETLKHNLESTSVLPGADTESTDTQLHWLQLAHTLQFSDSQEKDLFLLRRAYLQQQASLLHELQDLEMQLKDIIARGIYRIQRHYLQWGVHAMARSHGHVCQLPTRPSGPHTHG